MLVYGSLFPYSASSQANGFHDRILFGSDNPVCRSVVSTLSRITSAEEFYATEWQAYFSGVDWVEKPTYPESYLGRFSTVDIDGDGNPNVILIKSYMFRSVDIDHMHILEPHQFREMLDKMSTNLQNTIHVNPRNSVAYSNGVHSVPTEIQITEIEGRYYLLLRDFGFGRGKQQLAPNTLFVGKISKESLDNAVSGKSEGVVIDMLCRIQRKWHK